MGHYAEIVNGAVAQVIVAEQEFVNTLPGKWVKASYNTINGQHYTDGKPDQGSGLRQHYPGIGYEYDEQLDAFIPPKPFSTWVLDSLQLRWVPPIPQPNDGQNYEWDENSGQWIVLVPFQMSHAISNGGAP